MSIAPEASVLLSLRLLDDAAMFPPGNAHPADAIARHSKWRQSDDSGMVGPLLVHADRWGEFASAHSEAPVPLDVVLIGSLDEPTPALPSVSVVAFESLSSDAEVPAGSSRVALEPSSPRLVDPLLANLAEARIQGQPTVAKFRTGGVTADAFPSDVELAHCVYAAFKAGVPFKLTAGLHHALRHTDVRTGFEHHGFLNVMVAVSRCLTGAGEGAVADVLAIRDSTDVVAEIDGWSADDVAAVRSVFLSFGCCEVGEPIADLDSLGLLPTARR